MKTLTCCLLLVTSLCMSQIYRSATDDRFKPKIEFEKDNILPDYVTLHTNFDIQKHPELIGLLAQIDGIERIHSDHHYELTLIYGRMFNLATIETKCVVVIANYFKNGITVSQSDTRKPYSPD